MHLKGLIEVLQENKGNPLLISYYNDNGSFNEFGCEKLYFINGELELEIGTEDNEFPICIIPINNIKEVIVEEGRTVIMSKGEHYILGFC